MSAAVYNAMTTATTKLNIKNEEKLIDGSIIRSQMNANCHMTNNFFASFFALLLIVIFMIFGAVDKSMTRTL